MCFSTSLALLFGASQIYDALHQRRAWSRKVLLSVAHHSFHSCALFNPRQRCTFATYSAPVRNFTFVITCFSLFGPFYLQFQVHFFGEQSSLRLKYFHFRCWRIAPTISLKSPSAVCFLAVTLPTCRTCTVVPAHNWMF